MDPTNILHLKEKLETEIGVILGNRLVRRRRRIWSVTLKFGECSGAKSY